MSNLERKLNYLLAKISTLSRPDDPEILKWLSDNQSNLETLIDVKEIFEDEGITIQDLTSQLQYGNEFRTLVQFEHEYKTINNRNYVGASAGTFSFENSMYERFLQDLRKLPSTTNDSPPLTNGIILIPLNSVVIKSTRSSNYFTSKGKTTSINVDQNQTGPLITINVNSITESIQGVNSQIIGMSQLTSVIQQRILILPFIKINDNVEVSNLEAVLDVENNEITLITSQSKVTFQADHFSDFINDLPNGVKMITNIFSTYFDDNYLMFKQLYISTLLQELIPQITDYYSQTYGNNITYGLYGQGSAVSISQLYNLASSTLRREEVSYNLQQPSSNIRPCFFANKFTGEDSFIYDLPFTTDQVWYVAKPSSTSSINNSWRWNNFPILLQGCTSENGQVILSQDLKNQRPVIDKITLTKTSSTKTSTAKLWFEERLSNIKNITQVNNTRVSVVGNQGTVISNNNYKINGIAGGSINGQLNGTAEFYGINLLVYNNNQLDTSYELTFTKDYTMDATKELYIVLYPEDLSSESTSPLQMNITWLRNGVQVSDIIQLEPQRIEYGTISVNAYVGLLSISDSRYSFSIESSATFTKGTLSERNGAYYEGTQLTDYRRTDINKNAFNIPSSDTSEIPVGRLTNATQWEVKARPGAVYQNQNAQVTTYLANPPFSWQSWNGKKDENYISLYLSTGSKVRSSVVSPLKMETQAVQFRSLEFQWDQELTIPLWGYDASGVLAQYTGRINTMKTEYTTALRFSPITGWINDTNVNLNNYQITSLEATGTELILPSGIYNQYNLSESITNLQTSVAFLALYADYLKYLLDTLDERVTIVEKTMDDIIKTLNDIIVAITPKQPSIGGQILSFISTSVGMFFPLTGLAIAIVGQVYEGVVKIQDGNITTGVMDITVGCLMSVLGFRKFKQRMDRKYGTTTQVEPPPPPANLPSYDELYGPPGYNSVGTELVPKSSTTMKLSSGTLKSADIYYEGQITSVNTTLLQEGLHTSYKQQRTSVTNNRAVVGKVKEEWDNTPKLIKLDYGLYEIYHGADNDIISEQISDEIFAEMFSTSISTTDYVKWMYAYANLGAQVSDGLGFDEEVIQTIALANFSQPPQTTYSMSGRSSNQYNLFRYKELTNRFMKKRNIEYDQPSTKLSITDFNRALNPYLNDTYSQAQVIENVYDYLTGLNVSE